MIITNNRRNAVWTPRRLGGLLVEDFDSRYGVVDAGSGAVGSWAGISGNGYILTQGTGANRPVTGTRTLNSINSIDFNGTSHYLTNATLASVFSGSDIPFSIYSVTFPDVVTGNRAICGFNNTGDTNPIEINYNAANIPTKFRRDNAGSGINATGGTITAVAQIRSQRFYGTTASDWINGTALYTAAGQNVGTATFDQFALGARYVLSWGLYFDGLISRVIITDGSETTAQQYQIEGYLSSLYGITLDASHPYYNNYVEFAI